MILFYLMIFFFQLMQQTHANKHKHFIMILSAFICVCLRQISYSFRLIQYHLQRRFRHFIIPNEYISCGRTRKDADGLLKNFSWLQITFVSANNACFVGRVSYPAMSGCYLSGMEFRPTIYFTVSN